MYNRHGMSNSSEYHSWEGIKQRCLNPNDPHHLDYGGRGIAVCDRWLDFDNFFADMGLKPTPRHTIERIDNDGNYFLKNCRWATRKEQSNNRRIRLDSRLITIDDVTLSISQWAKKMGFRIGVIGKRLKMGWSERDAVLTPINPAYQRNR